MHSTPHRYVIEAGEDGGEVLREAWRARELFFFLVWRDVLVRYRQTALGLLWAVIRPLLTLLLFTFVFGRLARLAQAGAGAAPYPLVVLCGLLPWHFFAGATGEAASGLINHAHILRKVYFPRLLIPLSAVATALIDLGVSLLLLLVLFGGYREWPGWRLLLVLPLTLLVLCTTAGAGVWLAALCARYRDFRHVVPFLLQLGLYASPVGFRSDIVPAGLRPYYSLNPLVGIIDGFRYALLGPGRCPLYLPGLVLSLLGTALLCSTGLRFFRHAERAFADLL